MVRNVGDERDGVARDASTGVRYEAIVDAVGDGVYELDAHGNFVRVNEPVVSVTGYDREKLLGANVSLLLSESDIARTVSAMQDLSDEAGPDVATVEVDVHTADGSTIPCEIRLALLETDGEITGSVGVVRDISAHEQRTRELEKQRRELERLSTLSTAIQDVVEALVTADDRGDLERLVLDHLVAGGRYDVAWMGRHSHPDGTLTPTRVAGAPETFLNRVVRSDATDFTTGPFAPLDRGEIVVLDPAAAPVPAAERVDGDERIMAANVKFDTNVHGFLAVHADRPEGFGSRERETFRSFGETVGLAITALERKRGLLADAVVEVELRSRSAAEATFGDAVDEGDRVTVEHVVPLDNGGYLLYVSVIDFPAEQFRAAVATSQLHESTVELDAGGPQRTFQVRLSSLPLLADLAEHGCCVGDVSLCDGRIQFTVQFPHGVAVSQVVGPLAEEHPVDITAQHSTRRGEPSLAQFRTATNPLTDRQCAAIEAAYAAGYYDSPRSATAREVADGLGISQSTLSEHLRVAERKLLSAVFDRDGDARAARDG